jgi:glycosyltransferase involved in cell wall biosynthesis
MRTGTRSVLHSECAYSIKWHSMRIVHSAPHCDEVGNGVVNVAVDLACKQGAAGHSVAFVSNKGSLLGLLHAHGVQHIEIDQEFRRVGSQISSFRQLRRALIDFKPDVVHAHMVPGAVLARLARIGLGFRLVTTVHNSPKPQAILMGLGDVVIAVSESVCQAMNRRGVPARKLRVVKNGPLGSPRRRQVEDASAVCLLRPSVTTVARLFSQKGIKDLITAFALASKTFGHASLYIVGDGPDRLEFERQAAATDCANRINFVGFVRDPRTYLNQSDIFVLASRSDPFPLVIPEAREAGCAIIATAVDGIPEGLDHGKAGILVPPSDPIALAASIKTLLGDPTETSRWRSRASANLAWLQLDRLNEETLAIYKEALALSSDSPNGMQLFAGGDH